MRGWLSYEWADAYRDAFGDAAALRSIAAAPASTFLPYLTGERTPWLNPAARGGWLGLALDHTRGTMMRAAFEGVAFSLRAGLDAIRASGATVTTLKLAGGGSVDARWRQLLADALERRTACRRLSQRGAARRGDPRRSGERTLARGATSPRSRRARRVSPGPQNDAALAERYARFLDLYGRVETWFGDTPLG